MTTASRTPQNRRGRVRRTAILLALLALGFYAGFIVYALRTSAAA